MPKVMIVTGASRGIGAAIAQLAAQRGYAVCINYARNRAAADAVAQTIARAGGKAITVQADVARQAEAAKLFEEVDRQLGAVDVLMNNAGIIGDHFTIDQTDEAALQHIFATNTFSCFFCAGEAIKRMSTRLGGKGGVIVNISSVAARHGGLPKEIAYAASKGAVDSFTFGLAKEVAREGIRVNALRPGLIATDMHDAHGGSAMLASLGPTVPLGRAGSAEEVAEVALWLASPAASYVHGTVVDVSGGR
ncbi:MAG TPA: SDR family oxidoreductase [Burkholderiales bacterium]